MIRILLLSKRPGTADWHIRNRFGIHIDARCRQLVHANQVALGARCYGGQRGSEFLKPYDGA